jgi:hypothetical protein
VELERYRDEQLYCTACKKQPDSFYEVMAWSVSRVTPDGTYIDTKDGEVSHYQCPQCQQTVEWGWELNAKQHPSLK